MAWIELYWEGVLDKKTTENKIKAFLGNGFDDLCMTTCPICSEFELVLRAQHSYASFPSAFSKQIYLFQIRS